MSSPETNSYRYEAFISYNHRDLSFAKHLHNKLERFGFSQPGKVSSGKPLYPIFLDQNELKAGSTLSEAIQNAIKSSKHLIVICSENSVQSHWVKSEISFMREIGRGDKIISVIPNQHGDESHVAALFGGHSEQLAADFRSGKNKYLQLSKIAATIMKVELDELYQRASRRKNKQMVGLGFGLTAIATLMTGLAANAYISEKEVVRQRQQSEEVIAFMIDEFRDDLETLDKLEMLTDVGKKAEAYFNDRDIKLLSDESIMLQSRTLRQLSDVDEKRGEIGLAKQRIETAYAASKLMIDRHPENQEAIREHAENTDYWGYLEYQLGHLEKAKSLFESAKSTHKIGATQFPDDKGMAWKYAIADQNIGIMILQLGRAAEARPYLERTLSAVEQQYQANRLDESKLYEYAVLYTWYIRCLPDDTPISFLQDTRQKQLSLFKDMLAKGARPIPNQSEKLNVERAVVGLLLHSGKDAEAQNLMQSIQAEFKDLLEYDPENVGWRRHLMRSKLTLAVLHHKYGRKNDRNRELDETLELGKKSTGELWGLTSDIDRRISRLEAYRLIDDVSLDAALESLTEDATKIEDRWKGDYRPRVRFNLSSLKSFKAELLSKNGRLAEAQTEQRNVLALLADKDSFTMAEQRLRLQAFTDLNRVEDALTLKRKLEARGFAFE